VKVITEEDQQKTPEGWQILHGISFNGYWVEGVKDDEDRVFVHDSTRRRLRDIDKKDVRETVESWVADGVHHVCRADNEEPSLYVQVGDYSLALLWTGDGSILVQRTEGQSVRLIDGPFIDGVAAFAEDHDELVIALEMAKEEGAISPELSRVGIAAVRLSQARVEERMALTLLAQSLNSGARVETYPTMAEFIRRPSTSTNVLASDYRHGKMPYQTERAEKAQSAAPRVRGTIRMGKRKTGRRS
jgi:hypothetical protein